jgi:hypothetical protein
MSDIELPSRAAVEYLQLTGAAALALFALTAGRPSLLEVTVDLSSSRDDIRRRHGKSCSLATVYWTARADDACTLAQKAKRAFAANGDILEGYVEDVRAIVEREAARSGISLLPHLRVIRRVKDVMAMIDHRIAGANVAGDMAIFNQAYRQYRMREVAPMPYKLALSGLRIALLRRAFGGEIGLDGDLLDQIFGKKLWQRSPPASPMRRADIAK